MLGVVADADCVLAFALAVGSSRAELRGIGSGTGNGSFRCGSGAPLHPQCRHQRTLDYHVNRLELFLSVVNVGVYEVTVKAASFKGVHAKNVEVHVSTPVK